MAFSTTTAPPAAANMSLCAFEDELTMTDIEQRLQQMAHDIGEQPHPLVQGYKSVFDDMADIKVLALPNSQFTLADI